MASSSSSHERNDEQFALSVGEHPGERRNAEESVRTFDVFINHRGPDVKNTLALELYKSLEKLGIRAFLDSEEGELGDSFPSTIATAIFSARVHIAIFSKGYADSPWCLEELVLMRKSKVKIIPVFYEVEPWALRHIEKGVYDQAFKKHEKKSRYTEMQLNEWKQALRSISFVDGHVVKKSKCPFRFKIAAGDLEKVVLAVRKQVQRIKFLHVAEYPVGLPILAEDFERRCKINEKGQGKARIVGICGMGGAGKTTLSKELFNRNCSKYTRACFLSDVREASARSVLPSLQLKLLRDLFDENYPSFTSTDEGKSHLQDQLGRIPFVSFLIVLDDIDHLKQLGNLLVTDMLNKSGDSLIIISTRDAGVLRRAGILVTYNLEGLNEDDARDLFCFHAFGRSNPDRGYEGLVKDFVEGCGRLPLSLQILGSHVKGTTDKKYWNSALSKVRKALHKDIKETLKISIDSLDKEATEIFMDIACFFIGKSKNLAMGVWEASRWEAHDALETLKDKFIVQEIETKRLDGLKWEWDGIDLGMHDHLRDLGREMADEPQRAPRRIWKPEYLKSLESEGGFRNILDNTKGRCYHSLSDTSMGFQITYFLDESASLLWLQLDLNSSVDPRILSGIPLQKLHCLRISNGRLKRLWQSHHQAPLQLKELQISKTSLEEVPDLGILSNLENVVLDAENMAIEGWSLLESLRMNISTLYLKSSTLEGKLASSNWEERSLVIRNFKQSTEVALNKSPMNGLENLEIGNQESVTKILISGNHFPSVKTLKLHHMEDLIEIDLFRIRTLNSLEVDHCKRIKVLTFSECPELRELFLTHLSSLETIRVGNCEQLQNVSGLFDARKLVMFNINQCHQLQELCLAWLSCLERIRIENCKNMKRVSVISRLAKLVELNIFLCPELESVSGLSDVRNLVMFNISQCHELQELSLVQLSCLERIRIENCRSLKRVSGISNLAKLVELNISLCPELERDLCLRNLYRLEKITVDSCRKLKCLELIDCKNLETLSGMKGLEELAILNIRDCPELLQFPDHILSCQERMTIDGCEKLNCNAFYSILNLKIVTFDIGRAVEGAESILNPHLFSETVGAEAVTEMDIPFPGIPQASVSKIIICALVVVERSTSLQCINYESQEFHLRKGRWIVTMVIADPKRNTSFISAAVEGMCYGIVDKGFKVTLMEGQEWKTRHVLQTIDDKLYQK